MTEKKQCEVFGTLEKLEELTQMTSNIVPGSLVFESTSPFWGYYNVNPGDYRASIYLYLVVEKTHAVFDIIRAIQKIQPKIDFELDIAKSIISFHDKSYNAIRVRHLEGYNQASEIQNLLAEQGIKVYMSTSKFPRVTASVSLKKIFCLELMDDGLFFDTCEPNHAYIQLPVQLSFDQFTALTRKVRNNWLGSKFDAALGSFIKQNKVVELARIYSDRVSDLEFMKEIQQLYLSKINV